jgi:hypothetical protein
MERVHGAHRDTFRIIHGESRNMNSVALIFGVSLGVTFLTYYAIFKALSVAGVVSKEWFEPIAASNNIVSVGIFDWLTMRDYEYAKSRAIELAVRRSRRGNISL